MTSTEEIEEVLVKKMPGAVIGVIDLTGTSDHFEVRIAWESFRGKGLILQHKMVNEALAEMLEDGRIHALKIKTSLPS